MKVLVVNCGSSSIKYQLFDMADESTLARGLMECADEGGDATLHHLVGSQRHDRRIAGGGYAAARRPDGREGA